MQSNHQTGWQTGDIYSEAQDRQETFTQRHETDRMTDTRHALRGMRQKRGKTKYKH